VASVLTLFDVRSRDAATRGAGRAQPIHLKTHLVNPHEPHGFTTQAVKCNRRHWPYVLLPSDQHGRRMFETVHLQIKPTGGGHGKHGGAFIMFNHFDQASRFHCKTIELLIDAVPQYWGRIIQSAN
jgi:hypothetical protein